MFVHIFIIFADIILYIYQDIITKFALLTLIKIENINISWS